MAVRAIVPANLLHWLFSVSAGIIMCRAVFGFTSAFSSSFFKGYPKLSPQEKLEWNNRGCSTFHAIVVAASSLYLLVFSDLFVDTETEMMINRTSTLSDTVLGVSIGYFLADLAQLVYHYPALGGMEYFIHHGLSVFSIVLSLLTGQAQAYTLMILLTEITTPFVNLRWYLHVAGLNNSKIYILNGVALFIGWLVARILLFVYFSFHMFVHFDQVKAVFWLCFYTLITVPLSLAVMNLVWFWKIAKGMTKTLRKARHCG
ncbi:uncharacterized protein LOC127252000 [Andrographis paniculata]|uniref:uncharacterized protein LOC127252000 n=1 Tax=Andrographis paniculata TaxID=175694 RepID=UPI0021E918A5|nr:uncharacterized protein LOC127252000 [Andrographis paniculata]